MQQSVAALAAVASFVMVFIAGSADAQWSTDPTVNLAVADASGEQTQVKLAPTDDGGVYVGWFDNNSGGYDVRLQKLDGDGNELWAHNGVLVADRGFSSTQDWDLDTDTAGNALLAFRDDRFTGTQVTAVSVASDGSINWSVQFTDGSLFVAAPKIAGTTDGKVVVAWTEDGDVKVQKLNSDGTNDWAGPTTMVNYSASDMDAADNGSVVISMIQGFIGATYWAQKIDSTGAQLWGGGSPVQVFSNALQIGNFPQFVTDGSGGGVFGWYGTGPLESYAQRIDSSGTTLFAANGVAASTDATQLRTSPDVCYNAGTGETFLFYTEQNALQSMNGVSGQKFDASGNRQWGATGKVLVPLGSNSRNFVRCEQIGGGAIVTWIDSSGFGQDQIHCARVDTNGDFVWTGDIVPLCSLVSGKGRLTTTVNACGFVIAGWADSRTDANDIYVQNISVDGELGPVDVPGDVNGDCTVNLFDLLDMLDAWGACDKPCPPTCPADFTDSEGGDPDCTVNLFDLLLLLDNWG